MGLLEFLGHPPSPPRDGRAATLVRQTRLPGANKFNYPVQSGRELSLASSSCVQQCHVEPELFFFLFRACV